MQVMKLQTIFMSVVVLAIGGMILTWMGPSGATILQLSNCEESDGGNNIGEAGFVQTSDFYAEDRCEINDEKVDGCRGRYCRLVEYSCSVGRPKVTKMPCPQHAFVCSNGRCVEPVEITESWLTSKR